ncbi:histidine kinase [Parafrankia sp. FMc2]|uniref:histidine kinase n=1 Tax=Parafrankia sp. FMc2 TaxID=3233196 RepID=UPI0034D49943
MRAVQAACRARAADVALMLCAAGFAVFVADSVPVLEERGALWRAVDAVAAVVGCVALLGRRRWPVPLAVVLLVADTQTPLLAGPVVVAVFTVAARCPRRVTAWVAALAFAPLPLFLWRVDGLEEDRVGRALTYFTLVAGAVGWGLFRQSRGQLIASLRERAELAEADAALRGDQARAQVREEIAREMHDVLGHRLSLLAVHAGALEFNTG